jgi:transcriptional regulator with XRE-family HTH domain
MSATNLTRRKGGAGEGGDAEPPAPRRAFERQLLFGEAVETVSALLASNELSQKELARRLGVGEARVSRILNGRENATLKTIADLGWALGIRFALVPIPFDDRDATPAAEDPPPPKWLTAQRRRLAGRAKAKGPAPRPR